MGWEESRRDQVERCRRASPLERLERLEQALAFAHQTGALPDSPRRDPDRRAD